MHEAVKYLGTASILAVWLILLLVYKWSGDKTKTFSKNAATRRHAFLVMAGMQTLVLPMFLIFVVAWFAPAYDLSGIFIGLAVLSTSGFLLAAWIPDNGGTKSAVHGTAAYSGAILLFPIITLLARYPAAAGLPRLLACISIVYMAVSLAMYLSIPALKRYSLYLQGGYIAFFHITILTATYVA